MISVFEEKEGGPPVPGQPWLQSKNPSQKLKSKQHKYEKDAYKDVIPYSGRRSDPRWVGSPAAGLM